MSARLFCKTGEMAGVSYRIEGAATIGRDGRHEVVLASKLVSATHARLFVDPASGGYVLEDLGSRNGTRVDGVAVRGAVPLGRLHVLTFAGRYDFIFQVVPEAALPAPAAGASGEAVVLPPAATEPSRAEGRPSAFALDVARPGDAPRRYPLREGENVVGRLPACEVHVDDDGVSRRHALVTVRGRRVTVRDLGSKNDTFVDGARVGGEVDVVPGATLRLGPQIEARLVEP